MADRFVAYVQGSLQGKETRLRALANNALGLVGQAVELVADHIIQDLRENYNTAEPGETYERTGDLGDNWEPSEAIESNGRIAVGIFNDVTDDRGRAYASLVQGPMRTVRHRNARWRTIEEIAQDHSHEQANRVRAAIRKAGKL